MKKIAVALVVALCFSLLPVPAAFAGSAANAALALGAFAVFNQIVGGMGVFSPPQAAYYGGGYVVDPCAAMGDPALQVACRNGQAEARDNAVQEARARGWQGALNGQSSLGCSAEVDPVVRDACSAAWLQGVKRAREIGLGQARQFGYQTYPR